MLAAVAFNGKFTISCCNTDAAYFKKLHVFNAAYFKKLHVFNAAYFKKLHVFNAAYFKKLLVFNKCRLFSLQQVN